MLNLAKVKRLKYQVRMLPSNAGIHVLMFLDHVTYSINIAGFLSTTLHSSYDPDCVQSISGHNVTPTMLQFAKTRKLSIERADLRQYVLQVSFHHCKYFALMQVVLRFILNHVDSLMILLPPSSKTPQNCKRKKKKGKTLLPKGRVSMELLGHLFATTISSQINTKLIKRSKSTQWA